MNIDAFKGDFFKSSELGTYDLITFNKVLEHVDDPISMLRKAKNNLKTNWRPILTKIMQILGLNVNHGFVKDDAVLKESYTAALNCLRSRFSFLFVSSDGEILTKWSLSTWSKRTQPAYARTNGTENDKSQLLETTKRNQSHKGGKTFTVVHDKPRKTTKRQ